MLAKRVKEWTVEWKQEGMEEGRKEGFKEGLKEGQKEEREVGLTIVRAVLIRELEARFGPLPQEAHQSVMSINSYERIVELGIAAATAPSFAALGLC